MHIRNFLDQAKENQEDGTIAETMEPHIKYFGIPFNDEEDNLF